MEVSNFYKALCLHGFRNGVARESLRREFGTGRVTSIVVTDGPRGAIAFIDGRWWHAKAFDVELVNGPSRCGDYAFGTFLAGLDRGEPIDVALRAAMAAAAMHLADVPRTGWNSIMAFAATTPTKPLVAARRTPLPQRAAEWADRISPALRPAAYMATGAALMLAVLLWLSRGTWLA